MSIFGKPAPKAIIPVAYNQPKNKPGVAYSTEANQLGAADLDGQLGMSVVQEVGKAEQIMIDARCDDHKAGCMNVTLYCEDTLTDGTPWPDGMQVNALVEFGQAGVQAGPVAVAIGNGLSFSVPGSSLRVKAQVTGVDAGTPGVRVAGFVSKRPYPKIGIGAPPLAPADAATLSATGDTEATWTVPPFTTAFMFLSSDAQGAFGPLTLTFKDINENMLASYEVNPTGLCPWFPIPQIARLITVSVSDEITGESSSVTVIPLFALDF